MQRTFRWLAVAALLTLAGCAGRDPNLAVKGMNEFGRAPGDYTLRVNLYDLDAEGKPHLASQDDASLRGFVSRIDQDLLADNTRLEKILGVKPRGFSPYPAQWREAAK